MYIRQFSIHELPDLVEKSAITFPGLEVLVPTSVHILSSSQQHAVVRETGKRDLQPGLKSSCFLHLLLTGWLCCVAQPYSKRGGSRVPAERGHGRSLAD